MSIRTLPQIQRPLCCCGSLLHSDLFIIQSVFKEKREQLPSPPVSNDGRLSCSQQNDRQSETSVESRVTEDELQSNILYA